MFINELSTFDSREEINALRNRVHKLEEQVKALLEKDKPRIRELTGTVTSGL